MMFIFSISVSLLLLFLYDSSNPFLFPNSIVRLIGSMTWSALAIAASDTDGIPAPRYEHCASMVRFGSDYMRECVWIFGGSSEDGLLNDSWILDIGTEERVIGYGLEEPL
jgi:hypothetical protein